jgi:hypothetical protein
MRSRPWHLPLLAGLVAAASCDLAGATPPTPFVFPTPNQTLTAVFAPTETPVVQVGTFTPTPPPTTAPTIVTPAAFVPTATLSSLSTRPNGIVLEAAWLGTLPTIDGDLADWGTLPYTGDRIVFGASDWTGAEDDSAKFGLGWDTTHLYLAVQVTDDKYVQIATGADIWRGDGVELQVDADLAADYYTASLSGDDSQVGLSLGNFGSIPPQSYRWHPQIKRGALTTVTVAGRATPRGYDLEARIPWAVFGITPTEGGRYGFALSISDNDLAGAAAQQSMVSSVSSRELTDPTSWGTLALGATNK